MDESCRRKLIIGQIFIDSGKILEVEYEPRQHLTQEIEETAQQLELLNDDVYLGFPNLRSHAT
jgi:hypothetical protein